MTCPDLCTATKCAELESRIGVLEQNLELLKASFEAHTNQAIPEAHDYNSNLRIDGSVANEILYLTIADVTSTDTAEISIPYSEFEPFVTFDIFPIGDNQFQFQVSVNGDSDSDILSLNNRESNLKIDGSVSNDVLYLTIADGNSYDIAEILLPFDHNHDVRVFGSEIFSNGQNGIALQVFVDDSSDSTSFPLTPPDTRVNVNTDIYDNTLIVDVSVGNENDSDTVDLPVFKPFVTVDVFPVENSFVIQVSVNGDSDSDSFSIEIPEMNCDELVNAIDECCNQLKNKIDNTRDYLVAEIEESENNLNNELFILRNLFLQDIQDVKGKIEDVEQWVTVDISGTTQSNYQYEFVKDEQGNLIVDYAQTITKEANYTGVGLTGIHKNLQIINTNLTAIHDHVCKAIQPYQTITVDDLYQFCDDSGIKRENFADTPFGETKYNEAVEAYFASLFAESKYNYLVNEEALDGILVDAPQYWATNILSDFSLIQSRINNNGICELKTAEPTDVVAIVASDKVLGKHQGKTLVLHLVTFENYPKRSRNSTYWQQQIPDAKQDYDWDTNFLNLVWQRGNLYCELYFEGIKDPVSGWFANKAAANSWFDSILPLTTATERNRKYHEQLTPTRQITANTVRPYRAFITSVNDAGLGVCEVKYIPSVENE